MSRVKTSYDNETQQSNPKFLMLQSTINRIYSQNKKIQAINEHSQTFQKMSDHVIKVSQNLQKLKNMTNLMRIYDKQLQTSRQEMNVYMNHITNFVNKTLLVDIRKYKDKIKIYDHKIQQYKNWNRVLIKKQFANNKNKFVQILQNNHTKSIKIIKSIQQSYNKKLEEDILQDFSNQIIKQTKIMQNICKTQMGHLQNLLFFFHNQQANNKQTEGNNKNTKTQSSIMSKIVECQKEINEFIDLNYLRISQRVNQLQLKIRQIATQINYIKNKKKKGHNHKYSSLNASKTNQYRQNIVLIQIQYMYSGLKKQVKGLKKYIDHSINKINYQLINLKQNKIDQNAFNLFKMENHKKINILADKLSKIGTKIKEYQTFYKEIDL